jgi:hypothetical protein
MAAGLFPVAEKPADGVIQLLRAGQALGAAGGAGLIAKNAAMGASGVGDEDGDHEGFWGGWRWHGFSVSFSGPGGQTWARRGNIEQAISNVEVWNRCALSFLF